ncbi:cutinase transcription factor 1 beta [Fusarium napiforme]|uniref:Cutinase transcription factor 1 beta n=1 Tax=Fusarium napiforme TaxID=42672 RepID=A0A8H5IPP5_9HYPO|nr:cutinase transcription factor 1 beta [Fusarium napiforme]
MPEKPKPMVFRNSFPQQQETKDSAVTDPMSPNYIDQSSLLFDSPESPSTCFENIDHLATSGCTERVKQQSIIPDQGHHDLGSCGVPDSTTTRQSATSNTRSHITYSYYPFLTVDMSGLEPDDVYYLESRKCLSVPTPDALDDFIREYFLHVHPGLPLLDEAQFWDIYSGDKEPCGGPTISLFLFQAMLFTSSSFVPFSTLKSLGFTSRRNARERYYRRAKLLLDICSGRDLVSNAQGALLLTYYATGRDRARTNSILLATAIQYAQGAEADQFHKRPDQDSEMTNKLKRLWWCCIVRDRILPLGVRRQLHITSINPALDHLTEQDFAREIQGSQVYSSQTKRTLVQLFISLCELAFPFTSVVQTVYGMGQSAADAISPMIEHQKQIEESIRFCEISLDAWYDKASIQFPTPAGITSPEKSLVLYTNLMYIYYYSARVALYQYEAFVVSLTSPGAGMDDKLHQTRLQLEDATLGITDNLKELVQLKVARFLPVSIVAYAALPLVLHLLDVRLAKVPSQTARKQGRLNIYVETMKGLQNLYDGVDDVWAFIRSAIDSATSGTLDTCPPTTSPVLSSALCSKPSASAHGADDWGKFFLQEPILYFRLSRTIDLSLAVGCYAEDSSLSLLLATAQFPSPSLIFANLDIAATGCGKESMQEKGHTEIEDVGTEMRSGIFDDIGGLDGYEFGAQSFQTPEFLDMFELEVEDALNSV